MIKYEDALKIAKKCKPNIDQCEERELSYVFSNKVEAKEDGGSGPVVVMKDSGKSLQYVSYLWEIDFKEDKTIRTIDIA